MKQKVKVILLLILLAVMINVVFFSLEYKKLQEKNISENMGVNNTEETLNLLVIAPDYFNPLVSQNKYIQNISNLVFNGLTEIDSELKAKNCLAKTITPDASLTVWEVVLNDSIYFHNGTKLTADDVIFTMDKIKDLGAESYFSYHIANITAYEKISEDTIKITLAQSDNFLPNKLDFPILSKSFYGNKDLRVSKEYVGTGAYKQTKVSTNEMILGKNQSYFQKTEGNIAKIIVKIAATSRPGFELLKLGEIDIADTNTEVGAYGRSAYYNSKYTTGIFEGIIVSPTNTALAEENVRQAILLGINRDQMIEKYLNGYGVSTDLPINPSSYLNNRNLNKYAYNPERAQDLLDAADWSMKNGIREKEKAKLAFRLLINADTELSKEKAEFIKENLKSLGIEIQIETKSSFDFNEAISKKNYDLALTDWSISDYPEFLYHFETNAVNNVFGFSDKDYDYYVYLAQREYLEGKSKEYFDKLQEILYRELPIMGLYFETSTVYYAKKIEEKLDSNMKNIYYGLENLTVSRQ
ncbi:MAG: peptide ABC transporter substrate-binding protein [Clostridia bacterium]|nr:peptide ABC transporter substrate-binding protein [Clostridia bacterium]